MKTIDIKYAKVGGIDLCLDLYMPSDAEKKPPLLVSVSYTHLTLPTNREV